MHACRTSTDRPTGLAQVRRDLAFSAPEAVTDVRVVDTALGYVRCEQEVSRALEPTQATSMLVPMLADVALGRAALTIAPAGGGCRTATLRLDFLDPGPAPGEGLTATGNVVGERGGLVHVTGAAHGSDGRPVALLSGWFVLLRDDPDPDLDPRTDARQPTTPRGLGDLLGVTPTGVRGTAVDLHLWGATDTANRKGTMHGGMQAALSATALAAVLRAHDPRAFVLAGLEVVMHRPVQVGGTFVGHGRLVRAGRSIVTTSCDVHSADSTLLISSHGTFTPSAVDADTAQA